MECAEDGSYSLLLTFVILTLFVNVFVKLYFSALKVVVILFQWYTHFNKKKCLQADDRPCSVTQTSITQGFTLG